MSVPLTGDSPFRGAKSFAIRLDFTTGTFNGYFASASGPGKFKAARTGSGTYTITLPQAYKRLLEAQVTNGGAATLVTDTNLSTTGVVNLTITEPVDTRSVFVRLTVAITDLSQRVAYP